MIKEADFLEHLKNREEYSEPFLYIRDIMEQAGVGNYSRICSNRIAEAGLFDESHVLIDFLGERLGEILIDRVGLRKCQGILDSYIPEEKYELYQEYMDLLSTEYRYNNDVIKYLNGIEDAELKRILNEAQEKVEKYPEIERILPWIKTEISSRKPRMIFKRKGIQKVRNVKDYLKCRPGMRILKQVVKECIDNIEPDQCYREFKDNKDRIACMRKHKWIVYLDAFDRFVEKYNGNVEVPKLSHEEILKYTYLGIKRYGRYYRDRPKSKTPYTVRGEYIRLSNVLEALSRLTLLELQQMFPVDKVYDGDKYGIKDYFYTIQKISQIDQDKPIYISSNIESILWNYENVDIRMFAVNHTGNLGDWSIYLNDNSKHEDFFLKLKEGDSNNTK